MSIVLDYDRLLRRPAESRTLLSMSRLKTKQDYVTAQMCVTSKFVRDRRGASSVEMECLPSEAEARHLMEFHGSHTYKLRCESQYCVTITMEVRLCRCLLIAFP